ncbi:MAG: hypothetical protein ACUVQP_08850, partial [Bacteroidales bacterium]
FFIYRYFLRGGFLDGKQALIYHFLQSLWFPFLIDVKYLELLRKNKPKKLKKPDKPNKLDKPDRPRCVA